MTATAITLRVFRSRGTAFRLIESFAYSGAIQGLNVFTGILLARALGADARGQLAAALLWPSVVAAFGNFGMSDATTYYAAQRGVAERVLAGSVAAIWAVQSVVLCGVALVVVPFALRHYGHATVAASRLYAANIPAYLATAYATSLLQGWQRLSAFQAIRFLVVGLAAVGLGVSALAGHLTVLTAVTVYLGVYGACGLAATGIIAWRIRARPNVSRTMMRKLLWYGVRSHTDSVASIFNQRLDQLLISIFLSPVQLGLYVVAATLSSLTGLIGSSMSLVAMPAVASLEPGRARTVAAARFVRVALVATTLVTIPVIVLTPTLLTTLFGGSYAGVASVARVLLVAAIVFNLSRVVATTLKAVGRPLDAGIAEGVALGATAVSLGALLPLFGLMGAAVASLIAYTVSAGWMTRRAARALDRPWAVLVLGVSLRGREQTRA